MANTERDPSLTPSGITKSNGGVAIEKKLDLLDKKLDGLYKDIYISRPDNKRNLDAMIDNLDDVIGQLQGSDTSVSGMSELLRRVNNSDSSNTKKMMDSVQDLFEDQTVLGALMMNDSIHNYIAGQNHNYDLICKYLPKLEDALEIKRDNVLCSDNFSKNFLNPKSDKSSKDEISRFNTNADKIEEEYDISEFLDDTYMRVSKYGEDFIYVVPYDVAFARLFKKSNYRINSARIGQTTLFEGYERGVECVKEGFQSDKSFREFSKGFVITEDEMKKIDDFATGSVKLHFNKSNFITNAVSERAVITEKVDLNILQSLSSIYESAGYDQVVSEATGKKKMSADSMFAGLGKRDKKAQMASINRDGLIVNSDLDRDPDKLDKNFLGAVIERIPRENILPIYIGKKCLGYYYFEFAEDPSACGFCGGHHTVPMLGNGSKTQYDMTEQQEELMIRYISSRISSAIDAKFINANKDLKEEIYAILSYNEKFDISRSNDIGITFIPAEDMVHCYFRLDEHTHRGISDLQRAVTPAMLYILLYLTDIIGKITRSTDKRVYYVKQNVETNVAKTMMNVVQQIKKGNMGMRQIESMNNILNIVGKYNDFIIPLGPSGDAPIQLEVMQGQEIQTPTDIMEKMEEAAVNTIMPFEFVNSTMQQDFATRFTMSNTRFLKSINTRQRKTEKIFSKIYTKVYNYEFGENYKKIEIILPPPTYLSTTNNSQLIDNINQMADKIIDSEMDAESDEVKQEWKRLYLRDNLSTYIDFDRVERLRELAKVNVEVARTAAADDGEMADVMDDSF